MAEGITPIGGSGNPRSGDVSQTPPASGIFQGKEGGPRRVRVLPKKVFHDPRSAAGHTRESGKKSLTVTPEEKTLKSRQAFQLKGFKMYLQKLVSWLMREVHKSSKLSASSQENVKQAVEETIGKKDERQIDPTSNKKTIMSEQVWKDMGRASYHYRLPDKSTLSFENKDHRYEKVDSRGYVTEWTPFTKEAKEGKAALGDLVNEAVGTFASNFKNEDLNRLLSDAMEIAQQEIFAITMKEVLEAGNLMQPIQGDSENYEHDIDYTFYVEGDKLKLHARNVDKHFAQIVNPLTGDILSVDPKHSEIAYDVVLSFSLDKSGETAVAVDSAKYSKSYDTVS